MSIEDEQKRFQEEGHEGEIFGEYLMRTAARRELEFITAQLAGERKDNARLRALIGAVEREGRSESSARFDEDAFCPWCHYLRGDKNGDFKKMHADDCPAFATHLFTGKVVVR